MGGPPGPPVGARWSRHDTGDTVNAELAQGHQARPGAPRQRLEADGLNTSGFFLI